MKVDLEHSNVRDESHIRWINLEFLLPSAVMSHDSRYHSLLCDLHEFGRKKCPPLRDAAKQLLFLLPIDNNILESMYNLFKDPYVREIAFQNMFFNATPTKVSFYNFYFIYFSHIFTSL